MIRKKIASLCLAALVVPSLSGCINDAASLQIDGKEHSLSLVRQQRWIWDKELELYIVVTRLPDCQRRHRLRNASITANNVDVYSADAVTFYLRQEGRTYSVESQTCEGFKELADAPASGVGQRWGTFKEIKGALAFVEEPLSASRSK